MREMRMVHMQPSTYAYPESLKIWPCWVNYFSMGRRVWVRVEAGNKTGNSCLFCFRTISKGLLCSSDDRARQMLQVQVCREGWDSLDQPGVPTLGLTLGHSLLAVEFCTGRWKRSNHLRSSKLKHLSALSSPVFCLGHHGGLQHITDEQNIPRFETPPKTGCPPPLCVCIHTHVRTQHCHPVAC